MSVRDICFVILLVVCAASSMWFSICIWLACKRRNEKTKREIFDMYRAYMVAPPRRARNEVRDGGGDR